MPVLYRASHVSPRFVKIPERSTRAPATLIQPNESKEDHHLLPDSTFLTRPFKKGGAFHRFLQEEFYSQSITLSAKETLVLHALFRALNGFATTRQMKEMLAGAHTVLRRDEGALYRTLSDPTLGLSGLDAYARNSSHASRDQTFGIVLGKVLRTILTGTTLDGDTWFQLEGAPWGKGATLTDCVEHAFDYVKYKLTGMNQGPLGESSYTEINPLIIETRRNERNYASSEENVPCLLDTNRGRAFCDEL